MSGLAGVAAALAVAIVLRVYFRSGYRSARDMIRHGLAAAAVLGLLAFVAYDMRHAGLAYLGITPSKPEVEFEMPLPKATATGLGRSPMPGRTTLSRSALAPARSTPPPQDTSPQGVGLACHGVC